MLLGEHESGHRGKDFKAGLLSMGDDGELKILEMKQEESTQLAVVDDNINTSLMEVFKEDYDALNENPSDYVRDSGGAHLLPPDLHHGKHSGSGDRGKELQSLSGIL